MIPIQFFIFMMGTLWAAETPQKNYLSEMLRMRDPFRRSEGTSAMKVIKTELEKFSVSEFKMVGISTGPTKTRALVSAPDGKNYFVAEGMKIGLRGGFVRKITSDQIQVREKIVNIIGEEENVDSEIRLIAESNFQLERRMKESEQNSQYSQRSQGSGGSQGTKSEDGNSSGNAFMNVMKEAIKAAVGGGGAAQPAAPTQAAPVQAAPPPAQQQTPDWAKPQVLGVQRGNEFKPGLGGNKK
jgi:hypothetical protein